MAEVVLYKGAEMADDLDTGIRGRKGGRHCQCGVHRSIINGGEGVGHAEGSPALPEHDGKVHLTP